MNYDPILDIDNRITKNILSDYGKKEVRDRYKQNLQLLAKFIKNINIKPRSITDGEKVGDQTYGYYINGETCQIQISGSSNEMVVNVVDERKGIKFKDKEGSFRGVSGWFKSDEGEYLIRTEADIIIIPGRDYNEIVEEVEQSMPNALQSDINGAIDEKYQKEGKETKKSIHRFKISFYDNEAISYLEEYQKDQTPEMKEYYLNGYGIYPDEEIEIIASSKEELISLANEFYLDPINFIEKHRKANEMTNSGRNR